jgi:hypothetical protein
VLSSGMLLFSWNFQAKMSMSKISKLHVLH